MVSIPIKTILGEAIGEPHEGQVAVGKVIRERARRSGKSVDEVCLAPKQFSFWNQGPEKVEAWLKKYAGIKEIHGAELAWEKSFLTFKNYGTHYHSIGCRPYWAEKMERIEQLGRHVFYREGNRP